MAARIETRLNALEKAVPPAERHDALFLCERSCKYGEHTECDCPGCKDYAKAEHSPGRGNMILIQGVTA
jgi:hypothetical protein